MLTLFRRKKRPRYINGHLVREAGRKKRPRYINGHLVREAGAECPLCRAHPLNWCASGCTALDVMDYR